MLTGIHVPLVTPFTEEGEVAVEAIDKLARHVLDQGAAGLVALGTTGEVAALTPAERARVIEVCVRVRATPSPSISTRDVPVRRGTLGP